MIRVAARLLGLIVITAILAIAGTLVAGAVRSGDASASPAAYYGSMERPPTEAAAWSAAGSYFDWTSTLPENAAFKPSRIFTRAMGDPARPAILLVHGYPTSSWDFAPLAAELARDFRVYVLDTPGYGFSDKPRNGYRYSLFDDARLIDFFVRDVAHLPTFTLVTHDKGDSVGLALLQIYQGYGPARPYTISHHVITNGNVWLPLAQLSRLQKALLSPVTGPLISRVLTPGLFARGLAGAVYSPPLSAAETAALASIFGYQDGTRIQHAIIGYLNERRVHESEWLDTLALSDIPTTVIWGDRDAIAPPAVADYIWSRALQTRPVHAEYWRVPEANHYLQHDQPQIVAQLVRRATGVGGQSDGDSIPGARLVSRVAR